MGPKQNQSQSVPPPSGTADDAKADAVLPEDERRQLQRALTLSVSRAPGYLDALTDLLRRVCLAQGWAYGEAWLTTRDESILKPGPAWARTPSLCGTFRQRGRKLGFRRGAGLPGRVLETLAPEWIEDVTEVSKARFGRPELARDAGLRTALALPVRTPRDVLAILVFYADAPRAENVEQAARLTAMLGALGPLLERKRIEEELRVYARQQEAVARLGVQALDRNSDIDKLLQDAVALVVRELDTECGDMLEVLPRRHALLLRAGVGWEPERVGRMTLPGGMDSHAGYALLINETLRIEDFDRETRFNLPMYVCERDVTSGVAVIIHGHSQPVGVLGVYTGRRRRFTDDDVNFLQGVANVLGTALERTRAAEALRERESRIRAIVETAVDGIITIDETGTIETFNPAAERLFGYRVDEVLGTNVRILVPARLREQHNAGLVHHARTGELRHPNTPREVEGRRKDGSLFPMHLSVERMRVGDEVRFVGMIHDLTRQKAVERALEKERGFVSAVLDIAGALVAVLDIDGGVMRFNNACQTTTGYSLEEVEGRPLWELLPSLEERDTFRRLFDEMRAGSSPRQYECECRTAAGDRRRIVWNFTALRNASGEADFVVAAGLDVTARREAEQELERHRQDLERLVEERTAKLEIYHEQLRQSDRLASVGTFAAGLGHDMNNVLLPVMCRLDALDSAPLDNAQRAEVTGIRQSLEFLRQLSRGLRLFALDPDDPEASDHVTHLSEWWAQVSPLLTRSVPAEVDFTVELPDGLPAVRVPPHRVTQAVLNLVVNAGEATGGNGTVKLWAEALTESDHVRLCVSDDGHGMSHDVQQHALEPFFTTKRRDLSTGLGLSLVHGVATSAGGSVRFESTPGKGTVVMLDLPTIAAPRARANGTPRRKSARPRSASISLTNRRTSAIITTLLRGAGFAIRTTPATEPGDTLLWITEARAEDLPAVRNFLAEDLDRRVIVLGNPTGEASRPRLTFVGGSADLEAGSELEALRQALRATVHDLVETTDVF